MIFLLNKFFKILINATISFKTVTDVVFQNDSITFEIFNADTVDSHYPYVAYTLDASGNGDTIQNGQMN